MALLKKQLRHLKALAHPMNPVVTIGNNGVSEGVMQEIKSALGHHELIKVKLPAVEKSDRQKISDHICKESGADFVSMIGRITILFLAAPESSIHFPS